MAAVVLAVLAVPAAQHDMTHAHTCHGRSQDHRGAARRWWRRPRRSERVAHRLPDWQPGAGRPGSGPRPLNRFDVLARGWARGTGFAAFRDDCAHRVLLSLLPNGPRER